MTEVTKKRILKLHNAGLSQRQIARKVSLAHSTVGDFLRRHQVFLSPFQRVDGYSGKSTQEFSKTSENALEGKASLELLENQEDLELATTKRKRMTEERLIKEEELKDRLLDIKLRRAFDKGLQIGEPEPEPDYERQLSQGARENLRLLLSKNTNNPFLTQYVQELQEQQQQQQQPSNFEDMLKFTEWAVNQNRREAPIATKVVPETNIDSGMTALVSELLKQRETQTDQMLALYKDVLSDQQGSQLVAVHQEVAELKSSVKEALQGGNQKQGMKEFLMDLKENVGLLQNTQQRQSQDLDNAKLRIDWERAKERMKYDAQREMATFQRSTEMIRDIREAITDSIQGLAKPAFEGHRDEVKAKRQQPALPQMQGRLGPRPPKEAGRIF